MSIQPLYGQIVVPKEEEKESVGIQISDEDKTTLERKVVAVGDGRLSSNGTQSPMKINVGDTILFKKIHGTEVDNNGEKFLIVEESCVLGIIE